MLYLLAQVAQVQTLSPMAIFQNELFKVTCDIFGFICDGKDLYLTALLPCAHLVHRRVIKPLLHKKDEEA